MAQDEIVFFDEEAPPDRPSLVPQKSRLHEYNIDFFHRLVADAGRWAFGVIFVEVWVLDEAQTHLFRPENGWWEETCAHESKFDPLTDPSSPHYLEAHPIAPGVGLPGALWCEASRGNAANSTGRSSVAMIEKNIVWRQVKSLADDPDQPCNPRLQYLAKCGIGQAAGVPFKIGKCEGLVVYMARDTANYGKLRDPVNLDYLAHATLLIGSAYSLQKPRRAVVKTRNFESKAVWRRARTKIKAIIALGIPLKRYVEEKSEETDTSTESSSSSTMKFGKPNVCTDAIIPKIRTIARKLLGANVKAPPLLTWEQTAWTFLGAFLTLGVLTKINATITKNHGSKYAIVLGPFGALMTLQYGLTAAPASQPRNAILGQTLGLLIAHGVGQIDGLELWLKMTLATSLAISVMVKYGVTHPPAGAAALLFSSGERSWQQIGMMLVGNVVAIACAALINNSYEKRQYPTFWGLKPILDHFPSLDVFRAPESDPKTKKA